MVWAHRQRWVFRPGDLVPACYQDRPAGRSTRPWRGSRRPTSSGRRGAAYQYSFYLPVEGWTAARGKRGGYYHIKPETEFLEDAAAILRTRLMDESPVRLTHYLDKAGESTFARLRQFEEALAANGMSVDPSSPLDTLLRFRTRWERALQQARDALESDPPSQIAFGGGGTDEDEGEDEDEDEDEGGSGDVEGVHVGAGDGSGDGEGDSDSGGGGDVDGPGAREWATVVRRQIAQHRRSVRAMTHKLVNRTHRHRKKARARSQFHLDKRQGAVRPFDVVRLLQVARNAPEDMFVRRRGRTVASVYREREKGAVRSDRNRTDPYRIRDRWSLEIFLVVRVTYLRCQVDGIPVCPEEGEEGGDDGANLALVDAGTVPDARRKALTRAGVLPRYWVRRIQLHPEAGLHVDVQRLIADARARLGASGGGGGGAAAPTGPPIYPHYTLDEPHARGYHRRDLLRIPQDIIHRFRSSVHGLPHTMRPLSPPGRRVTRASARQQAGRGGINML